jgi:serine/threonine protein phosphatase PrpC
MQLRVGAATNTGRVRHLNEDVYLLNVAQGLFVVCDGMGGAPAGEVASQIAAETIIEQLRDVSEPTDAPSRADEQSYLPQTSRLADAVRHSNQVIYNQARSDPRQAGMGSTVVSAWINQHVASVAHVGDSRAYLWHHDQLEPLTRDHSLLEAHVGAGLLAREEASQFTHRNVLVRVLGREPDVDVELNEVPVQPGDYLLLCSDGLTRMVPEQSLAQAIFQLRDPQRICDYLIDAANNHGGADNITVVVVEVTGSWWWRLVNRWKRHAEGGRNAEGCSAV